MQKGWKKAQQFVLHHCPQNCFKKFIEILQVFLIQKKISLRRFKVIFNLFSGMETTRVKVMCAEKKTSNHPRQSTSIRATPTPKKRDKD